MESIQHVSRLKQLGRICSITILSFLITFIAILGFYEYCRLQLQPHQSDQLPASLKQLGVNLSVDPQPNEFKEFILSYGDSKVQWSRNFDLINAWGPTFVAANLDRDLRPEIILVYRSSKFFKPCQSQSQSRFNLGFPIDTDFVVYDLENGQINMSCDIPKLYAIYFSERYRSFLFDNPSLILPAYIAIACTVGYLGLILFQYFATRKRTHHLSE